MLLNINGGGYEIYSKKEFAENGGAAVQTAAPLDVYDQAYGVVSSVFFAFAGFLGRY
jgi:hypothetical protein